MFTGFCTCNACRKHMTVQGGHDSRSLRCMFCKVLRDHRTGQLSCLRQLQHASGEDPSSGVTFNLQAEKLVSRTVTLHVSVAPAPPTAATAAATARRIVKSIAVQWQPSGVVARKLTLDPRTLGKITSALFCRCL